MQDTTPPTLALAVAADVKQAAYITGLATVLNG